MVDEEEWKLKCFELSASGWGQLFQTQRSIQGPLPPKLVRRECRCRVLVFMALMANKKQADSVGLARECVEVVAFT